MIRMQTNIRGARLDAPRTPHRQPLIAALLFTIVLPLSVAAAGPSVLPGDVAVTTLVQTSIPDEASSIVAAVNSIGSTSLLVPLTLIAVFVLVTQRAYGGALAVGMTLAGFGVNALLKQAFASPRPTTDLVAVTETAAGFGFPSGHTMATTLLCGVLLGRMLSTMRPSRSRHWLLLGMISMPLLVGIARIEVGAHWPSDVVGAYLWGAIAAIGITMLYPRLDAFGVALADRLMSLISARRSLMSARRVGPPDVRDRK